MKNILEFSKKVFNKFFLYFRKTLDRVFLILDKFFLKKEPEQVNKIFILGAPRTGSTFFSNLLCSSLNIGYFSNLDILFPLSGYSSNFIKFKRPKNLTKKNYYGSTNEIFSPDEAYLFWRHFYPRRVHDYNTRPITNKEIQRINSRISQVTINKGSKVFVGKNLEMSLRLNSITKANIDAYIVLFRNPNKIFESILKGRKDIMGSEKIWWSMRPRKYLDLIKENISTQIELQVYEVYLHIYDYFSNSNENFYIIDYEKICSEPEKIINSLLVDLESRLKIKIDKLNSNSYSQIASKGNIKALSYEWDQSKVLEIYTKIRSLPNARQL